MLKWLLLTGIHLWKQVVSCSRTHLHVVRYHTADIHKLYIHVLRMRLICLYFSQLYYSAMLKTLSNYAWGRCLLCSSHSILLIYGKTIGLCFTVLGNFSMCRELRERNNESLTGNATCFSGNCITAGHALVPRLSNDMGLQTTLATAMYLRPLSRQTDCTYLLLFENLPNYAGIMLFRIPLDYARSNASIIAASLTSMQSLLCWTKCFSCRLSW